MQSTYFATGFNQHLQLISLNNTFSSNRRDASVSRRWQHWGTVGSVWGYNWWEVLTKECKVPEAGFYLISSTGKKRFWDEDINQCTGSQHALILYSTSVFWSCNVKSNTAEVHSDTYSVFWMEDVGGRWVVHYDDFVELSAQSAEVFDVVPPVEHTGFPEEPCPEHAPLVQQVCYRVSILQDQNRWNNTTITLWPDRLTSPACIYA